MGAFDWLTDIIKNLFGTTGNGWVKRRSRSDLDLSSCNGVAHEDKSTRTCSLCIALNKTIFRNDNKPNYYHFHCKCLNEHSSSPTLSIIFPMSKIKDYLFVNPDKNSMMKTMGYYIEDAEELYDIISSNVRVEFFRGNYKLKNLSDTGQHFQIDIEIIGKRDHFDEVFNCHVGCIAYPLGQIKIATPLIRD